MDLKMELRLDSCPHCGISSPNLVLKQHLDSPYPEVGRPVEESKLSKIMKRTWGIYVCNTCGGVVTAWANNLNGLVKNYFPKNKNADMAIPKKPRSYLNQAMRSMHAPDGAVMLSASAVDAMLKEKGFLDGSLYSRINDALRSRIITEEMAEWAHDIRLDANDQRHADDETTQATMEDASRVIDFVVALGEYLFVLPSMVKRGMQKQVKSGR